MKLFTIESDNNITLHTSEKAAAAVPDAQTFKTEAQLDKLASTWTGSRLVEIWNSLPQTKEVKKFMNRKAGVRRIWTELQKLGAGLPDEPEAIAEVAEPAARVATNEAAPAPKPTRKAKTLPSTPRREREPKAEDADASAEDKTPRAGSKLELVLGMLRQPGGTTIDRVMKETGWQAHTVRGFFAGTVNKKMGLSLNSVKGEDKVRVYSL